MVLGHHTKTKGDLAVFYAQVALAEQGWVVCVPLTEHAPYDLIAEKDGIIKRVQVKHTKKRFGAIMARWDKYVGRIDTMCLFEPDSKVCYFVPCINNSCVTLRIDPAKNNQTKGTHCKEEFLVL